MESSIVAGQSMTLLEVMNQLRGCLHHLDMMGLAVAGACLDMTIRHVEREISAEKTYSILDLDSETDFTFLDEIASTLFYNEDSNK